VKESVRGARIEGRTNRKPKIGEVYGGKDHQAPFVGPTRKRQCWKKKRRAPQTSISAVLRPSHRTKVSRRRNGRSALYIVSVTTRLGRLGPNQRGSPQSHIVIGALATHPGLNPGCAAQDTRTSAEKTTSFATEGIALTFRELGNKGGNAAAADEGKLICASTP